LDYWYLISLLILGLEERMAKIIILGTANAVSAENNENTHLLIQNGDRVILVDCVGSPVPRLARAGVELDQITDLLLTHFHPDHVSATPLLLMDMWLIGRTQPLTVHGLEHTISRLQAMMDLYDWGKWPGFFPVKFNILPEAETIPVIQTNEFKISATPVKHLLPTIGIRVDFIADRSSAVYSSDTEPCEAMIRIAKDADILIHEASGESTGHSSARQAGEIARTAGVKSLYLIHYPAQADSQALTQEAHETYAGPVIIARDFMEIELNAQED
jgi:ribonuclease Z